MIGTVEAIDYDGDRVQKVVLRFPGVRAGDAEVVKEVRACERIGQGSFGTVYRAVCDDYPRLALKISTGKSTRLRQELDVLSRVCTKGRLLLPRFEFGALNNTADMIVVGMELCVPSTLHDLLLSTRITSEAEMLFMAYQAVQAVSYVHQEGCIHRDIKLQNFVFDLDGNLKLIDFGLACSSLKPPAGDVVAGTVSFMSPEMAHNALHKDRRVSVGVAADIWSLGIVLFSIFTQRNPFPSQDAAARSRSSTRTDADEVPRDGSQGNDSGKENKRAVSAQQRMNERLLRRVAAGDWQWPVGVAVSQDLKQLVNSILVANPERRPSVEEILQNKLWNLRRRYPPAAVAAFLGVQDDFLLSHDEAHLLRAVEERSAGVTASLMHSRMQSPSSASATSPSKQVAETHDSHSGSSAGVPASSSLSSSGLHTSGAAAASVAATTPPLQPTRSSLKVVQRNGEGGADGAVAVHVYDVRASTRKRSKPIREISVVMAEETAKTRPSKAARRGGGKKATTQSAPASRRLSRAASLEVTERRRASSAGTSLPDVAALDAANVEEELDDDVVEIPPPRSSSRAAVTDGSGPSVKPSSRMHSHNRSMTPVHLEGAFEEAVNSAECAPSQSTSAATVAALPPAAHPVVPSCATPPPHAQPAPAHHTEEMVDVDAAELPPPQARQRAGSAELVAEQQNAADDDSDEEESNARSRRRKHHQSSSGATRHARSRTTSSKRPRDTSLRQASSSVLHRPASRPPTDSVAAPSHAIVETSDNGATTRNVPAAPHGQTDGLPLSSSPSHSAASTRTQRIALELSLSVVWQDEADHRRYLSSELLVEHDWLLASFRLLIEEDQERYFITWLAEEQEKSAAHAHRFKEMTKVTSKKYRLGFVCDMCDYEFLPEGPHEKDLHFFHCPCGRDLCPDCYEEYLRQCTCSCCRIAHPSSCVLREHLTRTGGMQLYGGLKGVARSAAATTVVDDEESAVSAQQLQSGRRRGRLPKATTAKANGARAGKDAGRRRRGDNGAASAAAALDVDETDEVARIHLPRMSIAAMQQERTGAKAAPAARAAASRSHNGSATPAQRAEDLAVKQRPVEHVPEGPWRPFARFKKDRRDEAARQPTPEERDALLNGDWIRHFYLFPSAEHGGTAAGEGPYAFVYHTQPGRTGAVFLTSDFPMHSAVTSLLERQFFVVDQVDTVDGADTTRVTSLLKAKAHPDLKVAFQALQDVVAYDTNMMKQQRTPGTVSVYQAPRSAYSCNGEPFLYVRWFRFNEDRSLSAFLLSNGAVQLFVNNEYELRWFDETRKFIIRYNGVCELVEDDTFALAPAINHLLYDTFDV